MDAPENDAPVKQFVPPTKESILADRAKAAAAAPAGVKKKRVVPLIEVIANDRLGGKGERHFVGRTQADISPCQSVSSAGKLVVSPS